VWDSDGGKYRKAHLSLRTEVMTTGKRLHKFADFEFAPSPNRAKVSLAWFWDYRLLPSARESVETVIRALLIVGTPC